MAINLALMVRKATPVSKRDRLDAERIEALRVKAWQLIDNPDAISDPAERRAIYVILRSSW